MVCTGVYKPADEVKNCCNEDETEESISPTPRRLSECGGKMVDHGHRDLPFDEEMTTADYIVNNVKNAIDKIFELEGYVPDEK